MNDKQREAFEKMFGKRPARVTDNEDQYDYLCEEQMRWDAKLVGWQAAINSNTATSGEAESIAVVIDCDMVGTPYVRFNKKVPLGTKLYAIPPDQSARIAELVLALQKFIDNSSIQTNYPTECEFAEQALAKIKDK